MVGRALQERKEDWDTGPGSAARKPRELSRLLTFSELHFVGGCVSVLGQMTTKRGAHNDINSLSPSPD